MLLYSISIPYCYLTSGEPRKFAMIRAQKLADEKWERELLTANNHSLSSSSNSSSLNHNVDTLDTINNVQQETKSSSTIINQEIR